MIPGFNASIPSRGNKTFLDYTSQIFRPVEGSGGAFMSWKCLDTLQGGPVKDIDDICGRRHRRRVKIRQARYR